MIYLDNAATTFPKPDYVYEKMDQFNRTSAVNAGRGSYGLAQEASAVVNDTKNRLRAIMHLDVDVPIVFSPSITIALNQIINGLQYRDRANIYVSPYEHNAVARTLHKVEKEKKVTIHILPIDTETYEIDLEKTKYAFVKNKPDYIFINHVSNVTGYILPVKEIFDEGKKHGSINILDTAQSLGLIDFNAYEYKADIVAFAGPISFVGIAVPHLMKKLFHTQTPLIMIPACFLGGSVFCLFSDLLARMLLAPTELSISTVTAIFGAPVVLWIMIQRRKERG